MKAWQIFAHSVRQVSGNLETALKISGLLYLIQLAVAFTVGFNVFAGLDLSAEGARVPWGPILLVTAVTWFTSLWIAVAWHRFVLRVERPVSLVPALNGDRILAYLGRSLQVALLLLPAIIALSFAASILAYAFMPFGMTVMGLVATILVLLPTILLALRLSASLPGTALGAPDGPALAWRTTAGHTADFLALAAIILVASSLLALPQKHLFPAASLLSAIWVAIAGWIQMMVGASILTTLYGHYVEGRELR